MRDGKSFEKTYEFNFLNISVDFDLFAMAFGFGIARTSWFIALPFTLITGNWFSKCSHKPCKK